MASGVVGFGAADIANDATKPSPIIWSDCPLEALNEGRGYYFHEDFLGGVADTIASGEQRPLVGRTFSIDCDDDTVLAFKAAELGGYQDGETDGDDNDAWALFTELIASVDLNSQKKVWFECRFEIGAVADQGIFVGFAEEAALDRDIIADDCAATDGESYFGFRLLSGDTDQFDAAYKLDAGTEVEMLATVGQASAIASGDRFNWVADTEHKLGMKFNGRDTIISYVDGIEVDRETIASATFPDGVNMGFIIALKTGTAAAQSIAIDWARAAYQQSG